MINLQRIARLASSPAADAVHSTLLLDEVLGSSRPLPLPARLRLEEPATLSAVALGMGLTRTVELTYWHSQSTLDLADRLLAHQSESGSFGSISATAVGAGALLAFSDQLSRCNDPHIELSIGRIQLAADAALAWLSEQLTPAASAHQLAEDDPSDWADTLAALGIDRDDAPADSSPRMTADPIEIAIVLWQLAAFPVARRRLDVESLLEHLDQTGARHDRAVAQLIERAEQALACTAVEDSFPLASFASEAA